MVTVLHRGVLGIDKNGLDIETNNKLNMEKEQDFFSKLVESFPKEYAGLVIVAAGALFFIGACRRWKWVLDMTGQRSAHPFGFLTLMQNWLGDNGVRIGVMIMGAIIMICGLVLFILM